MRTVIEVFNQLTHTELADCNTFQNILNNHYNKFKMIYKHMRHLELDDIVKITCADTSEGLVVCIIPKNPEVLLDFVEDVDNEYSFNEYSNVPKPYDMVRYFKEWKNKGTVVRVIFTGTDINQEM